MNELTIGELAKAAGVGVETVRYYQRTGLLETPQSQADDMIGRKTRRYDARHLRTLRFIRSSQAAGFTLKQIGELIELDASHDRVRARQLARAQIASIDDRIRQLQDARDALSRLERACSESDRGPCPILTAFEPKD